MTINIKPKFLELEGFKEWIENAFDLFRRECAEELENSIPTQIDSENIFKYLLTPMHVSHFNDVTQIGTSCIMVAYDDKISMVSFTNDDGLYIYKNEHLAGYNKDFDPSIKKEETSKLLLPT